MADRLVGKNALITAAANGIGRAAAIAMAQQGAKVFATDIDSAAMETLESEAIPGIEVFKMDVRDDRSVADGVERAAPDILFNCAGVVHDGSILDSTDAEWDLAFDVNARGMYRTIRTALPGMIERGSGSIINTSSVLSSIYGAPNRFIYTASKAAVIGITKAVAADHVGQGIRCNAICPGTVDSPSWRERVKALGAKVGSEEEAYRQFVARQPMGRVGTAEEIAALAVYLGSDESAFTTGQAHVIDGGWSSF